MTDYIHRTIIVPAAHQQLAQALCAGLAEGDAGQGMFTTPLSPDGAGEPTHYISSGMLYEAFGELLPLTTVTTEYSEGGELSVTVSTRPGQPAAVAQLAEQAGMPVPLAAIEALFAAIDVSEQEPFVAMDRLGLDIINTEED